jgi:cytochrome P450
MLAAISDLSLGAISIAAVVVFLIFSLVLPAIYNTFFHPLRNVPGPKLWIVFPLLRHFAAVRGTMDEQICEFHEKYGDVVRTHPNELSFITTSAWKDIYGAAANLPKVMFFDDDETRNIFNAEDAETHGRMRRVLNPIFSERGARSLEPTIKLYGDKLLTALADFAREGRFVDMSMYWNLTTFDIIGKLAFGGDFNGLDSQSVHPWVQNMFNTFRVAPVIGLVSEFPVIIWLFKNLMPGTVGAMRESMVSQGHHAKARQRMQDDSWKGSGDFMDTMLQANGTKDEFTQGEIMANSNVFLIAGSETSSAALAGLQYWLLRTPRVLAKVTEEVRGAFQHEDQITMASTAQSTPYLIACVQEGLRIFPPAAGNHQRFTPRHETRVIDGIVVPPNTKLGVHHTAAYTSTRHFHRPMELIPERWLPEGKAPGSPFYSDDRAIVQPFGAGARNCIGQTLALNELRYLMARLLFVELAPECKEWHQQKIFVVRDKGPLNVLMRERQLA